MRNCDGNTTVQIGKGYGTELARCPWSVDQRAFVWLNLWNDYKLTGVLPFGSVTLANEPGPVYAYFRACERASNRAIADQQSKQVDDMNRKQREVQAKQRKAKG